VSTETRYVPAAGRAALTRLYDPVMAATMRERTFRGRLRGQVLRELPERGTVVDVGCGTGTFAITLTAACPDATIIAIDGDSTVLAAAAAKPGADAVRWERGLAGELPLAPASADAVVMSLLLHHLAADAKRAALADAAQVLRPGGSLHIADWGRPRDPLMRAAFGALQLIDGIPNTRDHAAGRLPAFIADAGFGDVATHDRLRTTWGSLELLSARKRS
jgi:ubiquinone/menaquinone biosynthesis C-methylase UbiE